MYDIIQIDYKNWSELTDEMNRLEKKDIIQIIGLAPRKVIPNQHTATVLIKDK